MSALRFPARLLAAAVAIALYANVTAAQNYTQMLHLLKNAEIALPQPTVAPAAKEVTAAPSISSVRRLKLDLNQDISDMEAAGLMETVKQRSDVWVKHIQSQLDELDPDESTTSGDSPISALGPRQTSLLQRRDAPLGVPLSLKNEDAVMGAVDADYPFPVILADPPQESISLATVATRRTEETAQPDLDMVGAAKELVAAPLELHDAQIALRGTPLEGVADSILSDPATAQL